MECARLDGERLDIADMGDPEPVAAYGFDILRPGIDIGHVFAGLHHMRSGIGADRPGADDRDLLLRHTSSPTSGPRHRSPRAPRPILVRVVLQWIDALIGGSSWAGLIAAVQSSSTLHAVARVKANARPLAAR